MRKSNQTLPSAIVHAHQQAFTHLSNTISETASEIWQDIKTIDKEYSVSQRALGGLKAAGGLAEATIGAVGVVAPEPLTTAGGGVLMAHGSDVAASGFNEMWTGKPQETFTDKAVTATAKALGANDATAHQIGDGVDMGISLGSASVGLMQSATRRTMATANSMQRTANSSRFKTHGVDINPMSIPEGKALIKELLKADPIRKGEIKSNYLIKIKERAGELLESGKKVPDVRNVKANEALFKVVPQGGVVTPFSPYFTTKRQINALKKNSKSIPDIMGLPKNSKSSNYDIYKIEPKIGKDPKIFESKVAPTTEGKIMQKGGGDQVIVPNRVDWTLPEKVGAI